MKNGSKLARCWIVDKYCLQYLWRHFDYGFHRASASALPPLAGTVEESDAPLSSPAAALILMNNRGSMTTQNIADAFSI